VREFYTDRQSPTGDCPGKDPNFQLSAGHFQFTARPTTSLLSGEPKVCDGIFLKNTTW